MVARLDADAPAVHVRCGSDIRDGLREAGYAGRFVEFADPLCQGPIPAGPLEALIARRAEFISDAYELPRDETRARAVGEWNTLRGLSPDERIVLWFEHDSYDQLILAAVLDTLSVIEGLRAELICISSHPDVDPFRGLGQLSPAALAGLWSQRVPVTAEHFGLGRRVWAALRSGDPSELHAIADASTPSVEMMAGALRRHLQELPWSTDGLSLTQRLILQSVHDGSAAAGPTFRRVTESLEPLPFLGDAMFWWEMRELAAGGALQLQSGPDPWPQRSVELTTLGESLLAAQSDWVHEGGRRRWVGGVPCGSSDPAWRWDPANGGPRLISRASGR